MRDRRSWHCVQLFAFVAFEYFAVTLVTRLDDRRRRFLRSRLICRARETHAAYKVQGLAGLEHGHARGLVVGEDGHEGG